MAIWSTMDPVAGSIYASKTFIVRILPRFGFEARDGVYTAAKAGAESANRHRFEAACKRRRAGIESRLPGCV